MRDRNFDMSLAYDALRCMSKKVLPFMVKFGCFLGTMIFFEPDLLILYKTRMESVGL